MSEEVSTEELLSQQDLLKEEYIKLLNDKDVLFNWGKPQLEALYSTRIGIWLVQRLQIQLRIRGLKSKLEKVRSCINQGKPVDITVIEMEVAAGLAEAEARIMLESGKIEKAKELLAHLDTPERSGDIRKLYRELAKQLHPDVNNNLTQEQVKLWHLVKEAYENGDLEKLKALRVVYEKELAATAEAAVTLTHEELTLRLQVLKEGIKVLQEELLHIRSQFPFTIEQQIKDEDWVAEETAKLQEELKQLNVYEQELTLEYEQLISVL
jgi:DnaJ domain